MPMDELLLDANYLLLYGRLLPEPYGSAVKPLFQEYARVRVAPFGEEIDSAAAPRLGLFEGGEALGELALGRPGLGGDGGHRQALEEMAGDAVP